MSDIELSPYHRALLQDLIDYEAMRRSLDAYERISGVPADEALVHLARPSSDQYRVRTGMTSVPSSGRYWWANPILLYSCG